VGEPFAKRGKAIHLGNGEFFTVTLAAQKPLFAEIDSFDYTVPKMKVTAYDPETGFTLLQAIDTDKLSKQVNIDERSVAKFCRGGKSDMFNCLSRKLRSEPFCLKRENQKNQISHFKIL
jgi:hypothetical protein